MMRFKVLLTAIFAITVLWLKLPGDVGAQNSPNDWPMAGANKERTSWTPETLPGNIKTVWVKPIEPYVSQHVQVIGADGKVFVSTAKGLYAFDANNGSVIWVYPTELPLGHSPTFDNGVLYVGGMDKKVHAINANSGEGIWTFAAGGGFYTNPVVSEGKVFAGNRDGAFYAIDAASGQFSWKYQTGNQILQSPALKDNLLYFASNDGFAYALNAQDGALIWKSSNKLPSMGHYSWWPVVFQNYVVFTRSPFESGLTGQESPWLFCPPSTPGCSVPQNRIPGTFVTNPGLEITNQPTMDVSTNPNGSSFPNYFETFPHRKNAIFFNRESGQEIQFDLDNDGTPDGAPISWAGDAGSRYPPIVSGFDNVLYFRTLNRSMGAFSSSSLAGWNVGTPYMSLPFSSTSGQSGGMPGDEPVGISGGGSKIYWNLCCDRYVGAVDLSQRNTNFFANTDDGSRQFRYISSPGLPFYTTPTNIGMPVNYYQEAVKFFWDPPQPPLFWNENDKVGPTIYQGKLYVILGNALVAFDQAGAGNTAPILPKASAVDVQNGGSSINQAEIKAKLEQEVGEIVAAGHLKPSYAQFGLLTSYLKSGFDDYGSHYWHNPADIHVVLLRALPHLSEGLQTQVKAYLQNEMTNFSPALYSHVGWTSGNQRDPYNYPPVDPKYFTAGFGPIQFSSFSGWSLPPHNIYALWKYAAAELGSPSALFGQIQTKLKAPITLNKSNLTDSYLAGFPHVHNAYIAGYKGYVELAKLANQPQSVYQSHQNELDRLLSLRVTNLTLFPIPPSPYAADHSYFDSMITAWNFMYLTPELAEHLSENAGPQVLSIISSYQSVAPYWMAAVNGETQAENALMPYQQTHSLFQALALIKKASQEELAKYLDTPIVPTGDLYYIDNLAAVIDSLDETPPQNYEGDANGDGNVDDADLTIWQNNYDTVTSNGATDGDFNLDNKIDGLDYVIWFTTYGS